MNELLFLLHLVMLTLFTLVALKRGTLVLSGWICLQTVLANLFVLKQIDLLGAHVTCSDAYAIGALLGLNLLREYKGKESATRTLQASFFSLLFFVGAAEIHLAYTPNPYDTTHAAYATLLSPAPRLLFASFLTFLIVQRLDVRLFASLQQHLPQWSFSKRNALSTLATQGLDTFLFTFLGLWGLVENVGHILLVSFLVKATLIALMSPLLHLTQRFIKIHDTL